MLDLERAALPVSGTIELCDQERGRTLFRVPEWTNPPEIIEWSGRRYVMQRKGHYQEAVTLSLYAGYNAEAVVDDKEAGNSEGRGLEQSLA